MAVAELEKEATQKADTQPKSKTLQEKLGTYIALSTAIMAALAGIASLLMARHGGKATSQLIQATNYWNYYQAKSLKSYILTSEGTLLSAMGKQQDPKDAAKLADIEKEKKDIQTQAAQATANSELHGRYSHILADAVTLFQIAIANAAIAALSKKPNFWFVSIGLGIIAAGCLGYYGLIVAGVIA
jgi:hypothetical protein